MHWILPTAFLSTGAIVGAACAHWETATGVSTLPLRSVCVVDSGRIRACGDGGGIFTSKDGGLTWEPQASGLPERLLSIDFGTPENGWAVGEGGAAVDTADAGQTWSRRTLVVDDMGLGPPEAIPRVAATGATTAWALARWVDVSVLLRTLDGIAWEVAPYTDHGYRSPGTLYDVSFDTRDVGWLVASRINEGNVYVPVLLRTEDSGASWEAFDAPAYDFASDVSPRWRATVCAAGSETAWLHIADIEAGVARLFRLRREGSPPAWTWTSAPAPVSVASVSFTASGSGYLVGDRTWSTRDGAETFRETANPGLAPMTAADFLSPATGAAVDAFGRAHHWVADSTGDVDGDGRVTIADAVIALRLASPTAPRDPWTADLGDVTGDGEIGIPDVSAILGVAAGLSGAQQGG